MIGRLVRPLVRTLKAHPDVYRQVRAALPLIREATWVIHGPMLRSRVFVANLWLEGQTPRPYPVPLLATLHGPDGRPVRRRFYRVPPNHTLVIDPGALLPLGAAEEGFHGVLLLLLLTRTLGSLRPYVHFYDAENCILTHGRWYGELLAPADATRNKFPTLTKLLVDDRYTTYLALQSNGAVPVTVRAVAVNHHNETMASAPFTLPSMGSRFASAEDLLPGVRAFLDGRLGSLYLDDPIAPVGFFFLIHDRRHGTWQSNHS